jgi:hypothetical protein
MATYDGTVSVDMLWPDTVSVCSASIRNWAGFSTSDLYKGELGTLLVSGAKTDNLPISEREAAQSGHRQLSFVDDYYYRIHVDPRTFAFGAVLAAVEEEFIVWNAWFESKTCSSIDEVSPAEFDIAGLSAPFTLKALEYTTYVLTVPEEGSAEFTGSITFNFPAESPIVTLSGTRLIVFAWEPLVPMSETLEWLTDVMTSKDGSEQRMSVRPYPRQGFKITSLLRTEQDQARFDAQTFAWQKRAWGLPIWGEWTLHTGTILEDATSITLDTSNADYRDDGLAIIWQSTTSYEVVKVETVNANSLDLDLPVQSTWAGDKWIMPLRQANMMGMVRRNAAPDGYARVTCQFLCKYNTLLTGYVAPKTYDGLAVLHRATYVDREQDETQDPDVEVADYGFGRFDVFSDSDFNIYAQSHKFIKRTKAECWDLRKFFHSLFGKRGTVYIPSFKNDVELRDQIGAADVNFNVEHIRLADYMGLNDLRTHLAFVFPDNNQILREITDITDAGTHEVITIDSALGVTVDPGDCEICFLDRYRLAEDKVEFEWQERFYLECRTNFLRVKA